MKMACLKFLLKHSLCDIHPSPQIKAINQKKIENVLNTEPDTFNVECKLSSVQHPYSRELHRNTFKQRLNF